ncbi:MAG TPA: 50S ribosomal protein L24 [Actinomycetota bacterium]|uniref:Large ribosomal subunit protein uL24 n=1 Tax=uncultured actinobacterium Rifle_16ft_4_minimus_38826 TaxID=1665148 RepID=A0A0H4TBI1_9ACTN|nr:50S ribosomal protein L24, large subunit ribosomal protein L24 [uncultured actinobacterium Rifle_16ft_4_minimus_38826]HLA92810.1 50S ribosomal protein L24 [Actinomycetota bacterium]
MPGVNIHKDDTVKVMTGKSAGHTGRVIRVLPREGRVMVEGAAMAKKHQRTQGKRSQSGSQLQQGGIIDTETFIDIANVMLVCGSCGKPTRVGYRIEGDGTKVRVCRKCGADQ